jgi:hypothetical protein
MISLAVLLWIREAKVTMDEPIDQIDPINLSSAI